MDPMIRSYATSPRRRPRHGFARLLACSSPLPRSSPEPPLPSPSPPLQGLVGSPAPFDRPGAPVTVPGQGGVAFDGGGGGGGTTTGAGLGGATVGAAVEGGAAGVAAGGAAGVAAGGAAGGAAVGPVGPTGLVAGPEVAATATGPGLPEPGVLEAGGADASGDAPGASVGVVPGGCVAPGSVLGAGEPPATGGALSEGVAVARATWSVVSREPARPNATVARTMLRAPSARTRRVRCGPVTRDGPVTLDTAPSVGPRRRSNMVNPNRGRDRRPGGLAGNRGFSSAAPRGGPRSGPVPTRDGSDTGRPSRP
jgi:hypothetical protein